MGLISELRRRNVLRMAALYIVVAWLIMQVAEVFFTLGDLPGWTGRALLVVLGIGFPIALIVSWIYELTPEGISIDRDPRLGESRSRMVGRRLDFIVISLLSAALLVFAADKWWPRGSTVRSIAVLPFTNMSQDPDKEYFSDGISEELLGVLAGIPELRVISRTSAFSFKGTRTKSADIAQALNVAHILDGSVRMFGDRVRITAQLIDARTDTQLWTETFDRKFGDIFAIQDEIATAVMRELEIRLGEPKFRVRITSPEAYEIYLRGVYLAQRGTPESLQEANALFKEVLAIDPDYAPAWDELANNYVWLAGFGFMPFERGFGLAREAIEKAIAIDPKLAHPHALRGRMALGIDYDLPAAARHYQRALELDAMHDDVIRGTAVLLISLGQIDKAMAFNEFAVERDPVNPISYSNLGQGYLFAGRWDDAIAACRKGLVLSPTLVFARYCAGEALLFRGDAALAVKEFEQESLESMKLVGLTMAYHALGNARVSDAAMTDLVNKFGDSWAAQIAYAYDFRNDVDKALEWLDKAVEYKDPGVTSILLGTLYFPNSRMDPRWEPFLSSIGFSSKQLAAIEFDVTVPTWSRAAFVNRGR